MCKKIQSFSRASALDFLKRCNVYRFVEVFVVHLAMKRDSNEAAETPGVPGIRYMEEEIRGPHAKFDHLFRRIM